MNISTVFEGDLVPALYKPPYTLDSTTRYTYQTPVVKSELAGNLTRFGCNKNKYKPAVGAGMSEERLAYLLCKISELSTSGDFFILKLLLQTAISKFHKVRTQIWT